MSPILALALPYQIISVVVLVLGFGFVIWSRCVQTCVVAIG